MQFLEGPKAAVDAAYARIQRDDRHLEVTLRLSQPADTRLFRDWAMLHDPATSWMWTADEVYDGALDRASAQDLRGVFEDLATQAKSGTGG